MVGPTGTGKTATITRACNKFPQGVLYIEVFEPNVFDRDLAKEISMKIGPSNIVDLVLGYFSSDDFVYYHLPEEQDKAMDVTFKVLDETATKYKEKHGKIPTLFIDGADILAKYQDELFKHTVHLAKVLGNAEVLTTVFVSSEGSILPIVQKLSEVTRSVKLFELTDIEDDKAVNYLVNRGLSKQLGKEIVEYSYPAVVYTYVFCVISFPTYCL